MLLAYASGDKKNTANLVRKLLTKKQPDDLSNRLKYILQLCEDSQANMGKIDSVPEDTKQVYLSDYSWKNAKVGWRSPVANQYRIENKKDTKLLLEIEGRFFTKGLYAHSPSQYTYELNGKWKEFATSFGFRDGGNNEARFIIKGDDKVLYTSEVVQPNKLYSAKVKVDGVKELQLIVEPVETNGNSWTIWVDPLLSR